MQIIIQIFGIKGSQSTRAAERFFKERGIKIQSVDLKQKAMAPGELRRFIGRFGLTGLLDINSKSYADSDLKYLKVSDADLLAKVESDPRLLQLPLVRAANLISIGHDEDAWQKMAASAKA